MGLQEEISSQLKSSMKAKDTVRTGAIRVLIGEFQRQPEKELQDEQVVGIIKKLIKSEKETLAAAKQEDSGFIRVLEEFLPRQANEEEVRRWIKAHIDFTSLNNKMQAMRPIMAHFGTTVDGNTVKKILQEME